jgi:hypothetical protein
MMIFLIKQAGWFLGFRHNPLDYFTVATEGAGGGGVAEFVTDHGFIDKDFNKFFTLVDGESVTDKFWGDDTGPGPGFNGLFFTDGFLLHDFGQKFFVDVWSLF